MALKSDASHEEGGGGHGGGGAGRWLLTYADLITLLMVFFVVMFSMSRVDLGRYQALAASLRQSLAPILQSDREGGGSGVAGGDGIIPGGGALADDEKPQENLQETLEAVAQEFAKEVQDRHLAGNVSVYYGTRGLTISLGAVLFDSGDAAVGPEGRAILDALAPHLLRTTGTISVEGYTDDRPISTPRFPSNWELSAARAANVVHYLVEAAGLDPSRFLVAGYGEYRPLVPNTGEENRARNRRVDIVVLTPPAGGTAAGTAAPGTAAPGGFSR